MNIAIVGGYGDVGTAACHFLLASDLHQQGVTQLRIGGRQALQRQAAHEQTLTAALSNTSKRASNKASPAAIHLSYQTVDFFDRASLADFVAGCALVLNCAGPSHLIGDKVAHAAASVNAIYVDVAGDEPLYAQLDAALYQQNGLTAVLSSGLQPGLTGLFPRWLAEQAFTRVERLVSYFGVRDRFTAVAADDYLQVATEAHLQTTTEAHRAASPSSGAAWKNGDVVNGALTRQTEVTLPFFNEAVTTLPLLSSENIRTAETLTLTEAEWHNAIAGQHILSAFNEVHGMSREDAVQALCRASDLDLAGRQPYALMLLEMRGQLNAPADNVATNTGEQVRTAVLQSASQRAGAAEYAHLGANALLSGAMAAITVNAALNGEIPTGVHYCAQVLSPTGTLDALQRHQALSVLTILETSIEDMVSLEEGAI